MIELKNYLDIDDIEVGIDEAGDPQDNGTDFCNWYVSTDLSCTDDCVDPEIVCALDLLPDMCECLASDTCDEPGWWDQTNVCEEDCDDCDENGTCDNEQVYGDINYDNAVNVVDIVNLVNWIFNDTPYSCVADINSDGNINVVDVVNLVNLILGTN